MPNTTKVREVPGGPGSQAGDARTYEDAKDRVREGQQNWGLVSSF